MVYFDNAATTFPKPKEVSESMKFFIDNVGINVNRSTSHNAFDAGEIVYDTRELICKLFNYDNPDNVVFTMNATHSLNVLLRGLLREGCHVIVSSLEHNSVMRTINEIDGLEYTVVNGNECGEVNSKDFIDEIKENTKAIITTHASNVCGTIMPVYEIGKICKEHGIHFIIDASQTAGVIDLDFNESCASAIAFTGHKGLLGPQGIGGFVISDEMANEISPLICGGTGSDSISEKQPESMPDKFEAGTLNTPGVYGLNSSLKYIYNKGIENIRNKELTLTERFINGLKDIPEIRIIGKIDIENRTSVVSLDFLNLDNGEVSYELEDSYSITTRCGLHCAPSAHKTLNTFPNGTVRFSFGHYNTENEIDYAIKSIKEIINK